MYPRTYCIESLYLAVNNKQLIQLFLAFYFKKIKTLAGLQAYHNLQSHPATPCPAGTQQHQDEIYDTSLQKYKQNINIQQTHPGKTYNQILFMKPCMNLELWNYLQGIYIDLQLLMLYAELFY